MSEININSPEWLLQLKAHSTCLRPDSGRNSSAGTASVRRTVPTEAGRRTSAECSGTGVLSARTAARDKQKAKTHGVRLNVSTAVTRFAPYTTALVWHGYREEFVVPIYNAVACTTHVLSLVGDKEKSLDNYVHSRKER